MEKKSSAKPISPDRATTASKSNKGKKNNKAKEEEEKRLEEEAFLKAQEEEKKIQKEQQRLLAEQIKLNKARIAELKSRELVIFYELINDIKNRIKTYHHENLEKSKWERYVKCDGSPNPTISGEIYTYLTLWKEDSENNDVGSCLKNIGLSLKLIDELENLIRDLENENIGDDLIVKYRQTIKDLQNVSIFKIDQTCYTLMLDASEKIDPETLNYVFSDGNNELFICLWANLSHNPRIKDFTFTSKNFSFTLPRPLTLAHVAVRCLFLNFDVYSPLSRTFACRVKREKYVFDPVPVNNQEPEQPKEDHKPEPELIEEFSDLELITKKSEGNESESKENNEEQKSVKDENETKQEFEIEKSSETIQKEPLANEELAILQELSDSFVVDLRNYLPLGPIFHFSLCNIPPQPKKLKQYIITQKDLDGQLTGFKYPISEHLAQLSWNEYWSKKQENQNSSHNDDDSLETTKNKKSDMNLTLKSTDFLESTIGADETMASDANKQFLKSFLNKTNENLVKLMKNEGPLHINFKVPSDVFFGESPTLARWDKNKNQWRTDEILDYKFNEETREVHFKTYNFSPFCLLQDRHVHMPFQLWRISPREKANNCMITIETSSFEINIEILLNKVRIYLPIRKPVEEDAKNKSKSIKKQETSIHHRLDYEPQEPNGYLMKVIEPFLNKWFNLRQFIKLLKSIGLNVFPEEDSDKFVNITNKNKKLEWMCYQNMALCSSLVSFAFSKWNSEINDENKIICLAQIHTSDKEPNSDLYKCLSCTSDLFYVSETTEISDEFNAGVLGGTQEHADLYHLTLEEFYKTNRELAEIRFKELDPLYFETCLDLLESLKLLTFS